MERETKHYIDKPWGYESMWAHTDKYVGKILYIKPGNKLSRQYHKKKEETIYVMDGTLILEIGPCDHYETITIRRSGTYHIEPGTIHRFCADPNGMPVTLMEVSTPEIDDVVRLQDDYNRVGVDTKK